MIDQTNVVRKPMEIAWNLILSKRTSKPQALREMFADNVDSDQLDSRQFSQTHKAVLGLGCVTVDQLPSILQLTQTVDIYTRDSRGRTSLDWAASMNDPKIIKLLLEHRADPNIADMRGITPLMETTDSTCLKPLIDAGADVNALDVLGLTPLFFTTERAR